MSKIDLLNKLPEVSWDRYTNNGEAFSVFGWIPRSDGQRDFIIMYFWCGGFSGFDTSSAKYSEEFAKRLDTGHSDCRRVENSYTLRNVKNVVRLKDKRWP